MKTSTEEYFKLLPLAERIHESLYGKATSHKEWCEGFNRRGKIITILKTR